MGENQKISTIPENSPLRMSQKSRKADVTTKDTKAKGEAVTGQETRGLSQRALNELLGFNKTDNRPRKWREQGPEVLAKETKAILGTAYRYDESSKKYFPMEEN